MSAYITPIRIALIIFPFLALIITLPYMISQYHRYGSIVLLRTFIIYSFILYLLCCYLLVILPLPDPEVIATAPAITPQLVPFTFVTDFIKDSGLNITDISTYIPALRSMAFLTIIFNVLLFLPLGIYLRYYFRWKWPWVLLAAFSLSLCFELTQLTGLYGIYAKAYRLFDVDDLITNTAGAMLGYRFGWLFMKILPDRQAIDERALRKSVKVTLTRRLTAALIDITGIMIIYLVLIFINQKLAFNINGSLLYFLEIILYFILVPWFTHGQTPGKALVKIRLATFTGGQPQLWQYLCRYGILYLIVLPAPIFTIDLLNKSSDITGVVHDIAVLTILFLIGTYTIFIFHLLTRLLFNHQPMTYAKLSSTHNVSTLKQEKKSEP